MALSREKLLRQASATRRDGGGWVKGSTLSKRLRYFSPVALQGLVYVEDAAGAHQAIAEWPGQRCTFPLVRPDGADPIPDLGTIACVPAKE